MILGGCLLCLAVPRPAVLAQETNMARLALSDTTYTTILTGIHTESGDFQEKDIFMPESMVKGTFDAASRQIVGCTSFYGHFGYEYQYGWRSTWRGWINPYGTPFMLADSIPGNISLEKYSMQAGVARPLGGGWSAGIDIAYDVALMAKHRDLRNKNTAMVFRIAPGIHWQGSSFSAGFDAGYERGTEKVEYSQESSSVEHVLYSIYGLWVAQGHGFASAETKRLKEDDRFFGGIQLGLKAGRVELQNSFRVSWNREMQTETGYNNLQHGAVRHWVWRDDLRLNIGSRHSLEAGVSWSTMQGLRPLQRQELDPASKVRVWVNVGDPVFCYFRRYDKEYINYIYGDTWQISAGLENLRIMHAYTEYPQRFDQRVSSLVPYVGASLPLGSCWRLATAFSYNYCYEAEYDISQWQLAVPLEQQCRFWTGNSIGSRLHIDWTRGRMAVGFEYGCNVATAFDGARHDVSLSFALSF